MKFHPVFLIILVLYACSSEQAESVTTVIPQPLSMETPPGFYRLNEKTRINFDDGLENEAALLSGYLARYTGFTIEYGTEKNQQNAIRLELNPAIESPEGYTLKVDGKQMVISGQSPAGVFYGIQTLMQLIPLTEGKTRRIPAVVIADEPRFPYRGMHLDVCRHFFEVDFIKKMLDAMAAHKLNRFHWHLTEDQGWRIEINKYPELTEVGAWRGSTLIGHASEKPEKFDSVHYGGYYTQEQIKEVVEYAESRHITVIPEIEMPGHAQAALATYPWLGCFNQKVEVWNKWGVSENVYCAGKESTFEFLENVLSEVADLFPGEYIHIGGDECPKEHWKKCPHCQARMKKEGLADEHELQSYFVQRIEKFLNAKGKKIIGWDEILEGGLAPNATVMSWRGEEGGIAAARQQHDVIMTPYEFCYFDYYQGDPATEPLAIGGMNTLEKVYGFEPVPAVLNDQESKYILGAQANLWTEYIPTPEHAEYMIFPRLCALSEVCWTVPGNKDFETFSLRLKRHQTNLSQQGLNYRKTE
ncbi:MAG TPA: beta-N-acetylhexosaminidase [Prolixibacteraceae bacterium]|nr:beta-N-acetylhexosaminidase [Prolixibacteraceae bacterium]